LGVTNSCPKAIRELQETSKSLLAVDGFPGGFRKANSSSHAALEQLLHPTARGFRKICENYKAFYKRIQIKLDD
jgi:hypothetical protein